MTERLKNSVVQIIIPLWLGVFAISCGSNGDDQTGILERQDTLIPSQKIPAGKPVIYDISLAEAPPEIIQLSQKPAPVEIEAGFYVNMQNFNTRQGLALSSILSAHKDHFGNLWFGTAGNGVSRYSGTGFTNFSSAHGLIHNLIQTIAEDAEGNMWFGTYGGVSKYDGASFHNFTVDNGLIDNDVVKIFSDSQGRVWMGTAKGLCRYNPEYKSRGEAEFMCYEGESEGLNKEVRDIIEDHEGQIWVAGENGVWRLNGDKLNAKSSFTDFTEKIGIKNSNATALAVDSTGVIWVGSTDSIYRFEPASPEKKFEPISIPESGNRSVNCITVDSRGMVWVGTKGGVARYNPENDNFIVLTKEQGLSFNRVNSITEDESGSLWFGTYGGGVHRYDGESVIEYSAEQGMPGNAVYATSRDVDGDMWFAPSGSGIVKFIERDNSPYRGTYISYTRNQGLLSDTYYAVAKNSKGDMYFGCYTGITKFEDDEIINYTVKNGLPNSNITALYCDKADRLWIGSFDGGVSIFDGESFQKLTTEQGLIHNTVWAITEDSEGIIWIATRGGLSRYDGNSFMNFTKDQGMADTKLSDVIQDDNGNILIGTWGGGMSIIKKERVMELMRGDGDYAEPIFTNFSTTDGLANDVVYQIVEDESGNIIIGTNVGFTILRGGVKLEDNQLVKDVIENYNENTDYPIKDISNNNSIHTGEPGIIWAGTGDKVVRFDYKNFRGSKKPPQVILERIKLNNEPISWRSLEWAKKNNSKIPFVKSGTPAYVTDELLTFNKKIATSALNTMIDKYSDVRFDSIQPFYAIPVNLKLPYSNNTINFDFTEVETTRPGLIQYQYMLEGYDSDWGAITEAGTATYGNMHEGEYLFMVKARNPAGVWSRPLEYRFEIMPPWYSSWYAYALYLFLFLLLLYFIDYIQRKRVLYIERQKGMQRELLHAREIKQAFTELKATQEQLIHSEKMASLGQLTAGIAHEIQNPLNFVTNFSEVSNEMLEEMKEEIANGNYADVVDIVADVQQNIEKIKFHGQRADAIVKGMLQHSRTNSGSAELVDINALVDEFFHLAYHGLRAKDKSFNARLESNFDENMGKIESVPQDIGRVVLNLITNAFYACNEKRKMLLAQKQEGNLPADSPPFEPMVKVGTKRLRNTVEIIVRDNGNGIPKQIREKIFQPFFTTKPSGEGTGLGLSLSYDIVKLHRGELTVDTEEGKFTEFKIILPIHTS